jgi:hypothetical protein
MRCSNLPNNRFPMIFSKNTKNTIFRVILLASIFLNPVENFITNGCYAINCYSITSYIYFSTFQLFNFSTFQLLKKLSKTILNQLLKKLSKTILNQLLKKLSKTILNQLLKKLSKTILKLFGFAPLFKSGINAYTYARESYEAFFADARSWSCDDADAWCHLCACEIWTWTWTWIEILTGSGNGNGIWSVYVYVHGFFCGHACRRPSR